MGFLVSVGLDWSPWCELTPSQPVRGLDVGLTSFPTQ